MTKNSQDKINILQQRAEIRTNCQQFKVQYFVLSLYLKLYGDESNLCSVILSAAAKIK